MAASIDELRARNAEITARLQEMDQERGVDHFSPEENVEWHTLNDEFDENERIIGEQVARTARLEELAGDTKRTEPAAFHTAPASSTRGDDIYDMTTLRSLPSEEAATREMRDRVKRAVDVAHFPYEPSRLDKATGQEHISRLLERFGEGEDLWRFSRRILTTGSPAYKRAFGKAIAGKALTTEETRQLSNTDAAGGYAVPYVLDPTVIPVSNSSVNPMRNVSRVEQITTDTWKGVTAAAITSAYAADSTETSDNKPTIGTVSIDVEKAQAFIPFTIEIDQDWGAMQSEMATLLADSKDDLEATKFILGAGSGSREPFGLITGATTTTTSATGGAFVVADLYKIEADLPARFRPRAQWVANRSIYQRIRQFDTTGGAQMWVQLGAGVEGQAPNRSNIGVELLGWPAHESTAMETSIAKDKLFLAIGDFRYYVIVNRIGLNVELVPHLFGTARNYPSGERGLYCYWRNSGKVVDAAAFRVLKGGA